MANDTFATFLQVSALGSSDYLVGYQNISETRIAYNDLASSLVRFVSGNDSVIISSSANWNSTYSTVNANSASWEESAEILPTVINYLSTTNILVSAITVDNLSAIDITTTSISARILSASRISIVHDTVNDGTNPSIFMGENDITGADGLLGLSGFNMFYDEPTNRLTLTSQFSTVSAPIFSVDRYGVANSPFLPYTFTYVPYITTGPAQGITNLTVNGAYTAPALSGFIPGFEIERRLGVGKGSVKIVSLLGFPPSNFAKGYQFQMSSNINFSPNTPIIDQTQTNTIAAGSRSAYRNIEGFQIAPGLMAFPCVTAVNLNPQVGGLQYFQFSQGNDVYFRFVLSSAEVGTQFALSGAAVSIIP